jgi:RNA polymerase sigma factor (sigma-70 family)
MQSQNKNYTGTENSCNLTLKWLQSQRGENHCEKFYDLLQKNISTWIRGYMHKYNYKLPQSEFEDLQQNILCRIWQVDLPRYQAAQASLSAFLQKRVYWSLIDCIRHCSRRRENLYAEHSFLQQDTFDLEEEILHNEDMREREGQYTVIQECLKEYDDKNASFVLRRSYFDGVKLEEIAQELGIHPSNVSRARKRGLCWLQRKVQEYTQCERITFHTTQLQG